MEGSDGSEARREVKQGRKETCTGSFDANTKRETRNLDR